MVAEEAIKYLKNKEPNIKINADDFLSSNINTEVTNNLYGQLIMVGFQCDNVKCSFIDRINTFCLLYRKE